MNTADRITTTFLALVAIASSAWGAVTFHQETPTGPIRWAPSSIVTIDSSSPVAAEALLALRSWEGATPLTFASAPGGNIKVEVLDPANPRAGGEASKVVQDRQIIGCSINISTTLQEDLVLPVLTHEIGHCLGLKHDMTGTPSIMYYDMGGWETGIFSFDMTDHDLDILRRTYAL